MIILEKRKGIAPIVILLILAILGGGTYVAVKKQKEAKEKKVMEQVKKDNGINQRNEANAVGGVNVSFTVTASNFAYDVKTIKVKKGDRVEIFFKNAEGFHDLKIDEFNASTAKLQAGGSQVIDFVADKSGTFEYYCSVGSHRAMGMKGNLIVE